MIEVKPTIMDRMVAAFSPERGLKRMAARASLSAVASLSAPSSSPTDPGGRVWGRGGYKGGHSDRRQTRGWFARARSANADTLGNQRTLIARARDATMNMPLAAALIERPVTFTVGTGLMAIPDLDADRLGIDPDAALKLASQIAADYDSYMASKDPDAERSATGYGLQEIILRSTLEAGDVLQLRVMPNAQPGRRHETGWKLIEADRIVSPYGHIDGARLEGVAGVPGNVCAGGVEVDNFGAPIAFHVIKKVPDSYGWGALYGRMPEDTIRIAAWGTRSSLPSAMLVMAKRRPEQFRGVSILAPVLEALQQVSTLTESELFAAIMQAMIAVVYKSPGAQAMPEPVYGPPEGALPATAGLDVPTNPLGNYRLEQGTILEIDSEAGAEMKSPGRPNPAFDPFWQALARQISAGTGMPFEVVMLSFTASYSASRGSIEMAYLKTRTKREWMASHSETPRYEAWLYEQVAKGVYSMPGFLANAARRALWSNVRFRGDGKISLDPAREAIAYEKREQHAWQTGAEITAELTGGDYDANVKRRIGEHKRFVAGGLPIPGAVGGGAAPPPLNEPAGGQSNQAEVD